MSIKTELVEHNFSRDPEYYHQSAAVQKKAAERLISILLEDVRHSEIGNILEVGCGTGFLTQMIVDNFPGVSLLVTDISPVMLDFCKNNLRNSQNISCEFKVNDITERCPEGKFDLILSSLAFQWVEDSSKLMNSLKKSLADGGRLCFSTLLSGTFANIAEIFRKYDVDFPMPLLPEYGELEKIVSLFPEFEVKEESSTEQYDSMKSFLDHIHRVGAGNASGIPVPVSKLREIIRGESGKGELEALYKIAYVSCRV